MNSDLPPWLIAWGFSAAVIIPSLAVAAIALWIEKRDPL
jgi:hypothetical protein